MSAKPPPLPTCRNRTAEPQSAWADDEASQPPPLPPSARAAERVRIVPDDAPRAQLTRWSGAMVPWIASFLYHQALLLGLAFWMISAMAGSGGPLALLTAEGDQEAEPLEGSLFTLQSLQSDDLSLLPELSLDVDSDFEADSPGAVDLDAADRSSQRPWPDGQVPAGATDQRVRAAPGDGKPAVPRLRQAASIEEAVGGVIGEIQGKLAQGDLLVVWLLDASISLEDDRPRVAARLDAMFQQAAAGSASQENRLTSAAAGFGRGTRELVAPTALGGRIVKAVTRVPTDASGIENVFGAVQWAVNRYSKRWPGAVMIVVWTDESGNDPGKLEATIDLCRQQKVSVSVMGPSSILSHALGTHTWVHGPSGRVFSLAVQRGLDSALLEQCRMPYWYQTHLPDRDDPAQAALVAVDPWQKPDGGQPAPAPLPQLPFLPKLLFTGQLPPWYGGPQLERMVSGVGPYALTRLTVQTFGTYTVFDQPADRGPFRMEVMEAYLPDYRAADEIAADFKEHPLRQAVAAAAQLAAEQTDLRTPQLVFFSNNVGPLYYSPSSFRNALAAALAREEAVVKRNLALVQNALARFGPNGMEEEYQAEESARWRAWYDLTRGRLLALRVRHLEYATACKVLTGALLGRDTNHVRFFAVPVIRSGPAAREQAQEAERLLRRCVETNHQTPWAYLAQRELDYPLGIDFRQIAIPRPPPQPAVPMVPGVPGGGGSPVSTPKL